ncbi:mucin-17-like isoform X4 [Daphnia pulicaria]|uniref:mucin-17-like isoform X4 n=1 Tax=Daphnia pulicaria TaxID=35523 RepID=UPI001EEA34E1|nr:mucin-17-like isoform X4 [Daphnia pulicaria]
MQQQPSIGGWSVALAALLLLNVAFINANQGGEGSTSACDLSTQVACRNHPSICIELERVQDGVADCPDASDEDCQPWEFTCLCGQPRCISGDLVGNGNLDCADGSDEGLIGGNCKSDEDLQNIDDLVRYRRASSDVRVEVNAGQTTTFFLKTELPLNRPRPLGVITSTKGAFINEGTTTEYTTQIVGTLVDGTYAKIQSTKSRVFSPVPTDLFAVDLPADLLPTGLVSSSLVTRIRGETTTIETTEFVRTFIDAIYVQEILTSSEIFAPLKPIDANVQPSPVSQIVIPTVVIDSSLANEDDSGKIIFKTAHLTSLVGERVIESSIGGINPAFDEDKPTDDESKKIITSFEEVPDNNLRGSRARSDLSPELVVQTKPVVVLETFVANLPSARIAQPSAIEPEISESDVPVTEETESTTINLLSDEPEPVLPVEIETAVKDPAIKIETVESAAIVIPETVQSEPTPAVVVPEEPVVPVNIESVAESEPVVPVKTEVKEVPAVQIIAVESGSVAVVKTNTPAPAVIAPFHVDAVVSDAALVEGIEFEPEVFTDVPESETEANTESEVPSQDGQREPRVEARPPAIRPAIPVLATLQLRPTEPSRPVGLISSFEGSLVNNGVTTVYTSLIFGTVIDGEWANVVSTITSVITPSAVLPVQVTPVSAAPAPIVPVKAPVEIVATAPVAVAVTELPVESKSVAPVELESSLSQPVEASTPVAETPQGLLPVTRVTTFTFFTTFTETKGEEVITSVSSREVVSSDVQFVEETIKPDDIIEMMLGESGNETSPSITTVFKTYTYFSTLFDESTTKMITREEVESSVITLTGDSPVAATPKFQEATTMMETEMMSTKLVDEIQPSIIESSLMESVGDAEGKRKQLFSSLAGGIVKTFFTTFTFFTTALINGTTVVSSRIVVSTNAVTPTVQLTDIDEELWESLKAQDERRSQESALASIPASVSESVSEPTLTAVAGPTIETVVPVVFTSTPVVSTPEPTTLAVEPVSEEPEISLPEVTVETSEEPIISTDLPTPPSVEELVPVVPIEIPMEPTPVMVSSESPMEVISEEPAVIVSESPDVATIEPSTETDPSLPQTLYTTFTYLTTFFTEGTSNVVSREETVTNVITETDVVVEATVPVFPITYYTTFTYKTTSFSEGQTLIDTREETVTNIVTPTAAEPSPASVEPIVATSVVEIIPTPAIDPALTTFYTTFTYFATSFEADLPVVTSSVETITNYVSASETVLPPFVKPPASPDEALVIDIQPTPPATAGESVANNTARNIGSNGVSQLIIDLAESEKTSLPSLTGLLSTIRSTLVNNGITTVFTTDVLGTFINGQYARILESSSEVLNPAVQIPATVIVAASGVEGLEATDLFPTSVSTPAVELEGSIVLPVSPSQTTISPTPAAESGVEEQDNEGSKVDGGRITTRLSAPPRNRTFVPSIRPFTQRPRPPLPIRPRRPPFTSAAASVAGDETSPTSSIAPSPASISGSSSSSSSSTSAGSISRPAPFSSRFRPSGASSIVVASSTSTESSSRSGSQFFRLRSSLSGSPSSSGGISPTPVLTPSSTGLPGRRFSSSSFVPSIGSARSSIGGLPPRRPSILSSGVRPSGLSSSTIASASSPASTTTPRFARPTTPPTVAAIEEEITTDDNVEAVSPTTARTASSSFRRPAPIRPASPAIEPSLVSPLIPSRRQFPFTRANSRNVNPAVTVTESTRAPSDSGSSSNAVPSESGATSRPRFVRPPKLTFTEKPRPAVTRPTRPANRGEAAAAASNINVVTVEAPETVNSRSKRQIDFDHYFYDPAHYRRPSRKTNRTRGRTTTATALNQDYDYEQRIALLDAVDYDGLDYDDRKVTKSRQTSSATSALRDRLMANRQNRNQNTTPAPRTRTRTSASSTGRTQSRRPGTSSATRSRPSTNAATRQRARTSTTTERPSGGRRTFGNNARRPGTRNRVPANDFEEEEFISPEPVLPSSAPSLSLPISVTHKIPTETTIPVVNNGRTEFRTVIAAKPSIEVLDQYSTMRVSGTWRYLASEVSATPTPGTTLITQYVLKPTETTTVTFTPTTIRGRPTSFSHIVPSTAFEVETVVSTISDPLASTNNLLQQLLLGGLQQSGPVTSFITHTNTFVTTLTELKTTKIPITLRGQEIFTTIIGSLSSVITATDFSTETIITGPTEGPGNPLANLLPALLGNQLLQAQLLAPQLQPAQVMPIQATQVPQAAVAPQQPKKEEVFSSQVFDDQFEEVVFEPLEEVKAVFEQPREEIIPAKPIPVTSVITLFLSGRRPGEFSSILSTITLDGADATVVKRQIDPTDILPMEASELPFMVGTDKGIYELPEKYSPLDLDYYVMSAINEMDTEAIEDAKETQRLADIVKKAKGSSKRKVRQVSFDWTEEEPLEAIESNLEEFRVEPLPSGRGTLRRRTVTRKVSDLLPVSERKIGEDFVSNNRARKVVVVTRRRPVSPTNAVDEQTIARRIDKEEPANADGKPFVVIRKRPVNREEPKSEAPPLSSSLIEPETESPLRNNLFGDAYAPRTYFTVYSYFYTLLNGPNSGQVSTREVSISEVVRGSDGRIPAGFQRTENGNGLYPLSSGRSVADLSTRINNGITTQVNLASITLVKYGRGAVRASAIGLKPKEETPVRPTTQPPRRLSIVPTPRVEPSFDDFASDLNNDVTVLPTQKLPSAVTRTRGRALDAARTTNVVRQPVAVEEVKTISRAPGSNRGRGTVRFNPASVLGESVDVLPTLTRPRVNVEQRVPQQQQQPRIIAPPTRGPVRVPSRVLPARVPVRSSVVREPIRRPEPVVRNSIIRGRPRPIQEQDLFVDVPEEEPLPPFEDEVFYDDLGFTEDPPADEDYFYDNHEGGLIDGQEPEYDDFVDTNEPPLVELNTVETATPAVKTRTTVASTPVATTTATESSTTSISKLIGVTPVRRTTISRKLLNPLQSHLSSILANSRSGLRSSSSVLKTNEPGSSIPFRLRSHSKSSVVPTFTTSTVVWEQFQTLSTLAVDGGRSGIPLTLITSSLTTLYDSELSLLTASPDVFKPVVQPTVLPMSRNKPHNFNPTARLTLPIRASVAIGLLPSTGIVESTIEDTSEPTTESNIDTTDVPFLSDLLNRGGNIVTVVETHLKTFTAVITRKSGNEEEVTTRLEVLPELVTKTVVQIEPTSVVDVQASLDALENLVPTARAIPARDGREQLISDDGIEEVRGARLNVGSGSSNRNPNFATKIMSNGVEVLVANEKKPTLLAQNVVQKSQTVIEPSPPITLAASTLINQVTLAGEVENVRLFSSIQSDPARFQTLTQMTTFTYLTTLFDGASKLVSSREEIITNFVTQEKGRKETVVKPTATVTTGQPGSSNYNTLTHMTTYTYFNTFVDQKRPVVLTSKETVSNVITVPAGQPEASEPSFETATYLRTYIFSSKLDRDAIATSKEVVTQVVVTEAPRLKVQPTPVATFMEVTKTYLNTLTLLSTQIDGTTSTVHRVTTVRPEIVVETIRDFEPTPVLDGSLIMPTEDDFGGDGPLVATKTYFTTKTHFTTLQQGTKTIVQSRKEVRSSVVTETIDGNRASLFAQPASVAKARPTYVQLGPNLYGKLRTLFATATYFITNSAGEISSKRLVVPQVSTEMVPLDSIPSEALIEPSIPVLSDIEVTEVPTGSSQILTPEQLQSLKLSFLAGQQSSAANVQPSLILSPEHLSSLKESFLSNQPSVTPTDSPFETIDTSTDPELTDFTTDPSIDDGFEPPVISLSPPEVGAGETVIMVTNTAGEVLIIPTEILGNQPSVTSSSSSSSSGIIGGLSGAGVETLQQNPDVQGRRPPNIIPLRPGQQLPQQLTPNRPQRPPTVLRRPEPGVPLQPGVPGSPLLRPGASIGQQFGVGQPAQQLVAAPISFSAPPLQTGFTGMPNQPKSVLPSTRTSGLATAVPGVRPPPPPFVNGQNNIDRAHIEPSRPIQTPIRPANGQFFAANGQQINVPPLPGSVIPPPPASPPPAPPGPIPQPPVDVIGPGSIVPGPDGKPVRIVGVPEGEEPPPGAVGQVFIRPVPALVPVIPSVVRPEQQLPPRREDVIVPQPGTRPPPIQIPAVQTIASIVGDNKIVATNIINGGQTTVLLPNDPTPVFNVPSLSVTVGVKPSNVEEFSVMPTEVSESGANLEGVSSILQPGLSPTTPASNLEGVGSMLQPGLVPSASPEGGNIEGIGSLLQPGLVPSGAASLPPAMEISSTSVTPSLHEFAFGSESGEVDHTPTLNIFSDSPSTEIMPSVFQNAPSEAPTSEPKWPLVHHDMDALEKKEPFGVTSVVMGPDSQEFTTFVSRVESDGRTAFSTIIQKSTAIAYVEPTTMPTTTAAPVTPDIEEEEEKIAEPVLTFPPNSPFVPPTNPPMHPQAISSSSSTSTTKSRTTSTTPAAEIEPPMAKDVIMDNMGNKVVLGGGFGGSFSVNQPSSIQDGCRGRCSKEKSEVCVYANGQHDCLCRPGYSRADPFLSCTKTYTYQLKLVLESINRTMLHFDNNLKDEISPQYRSLASNARMGLKQALMSTDLSESIQDSQVMGIHPTSESELQSDGVLVDFFVHLAKQQDEDELKNKLMKSLERNNYILGDSDIIASRFTDSLQAQDFDECSHEGHHDCSEFADCINEKGTYRCQCRPGYIDSEEDGRICLAERQDCEECSGHGRCVFEPISNEMSCICNKWFTGKECQINLKVVMIVVLAVGIFMILLVTAIIVVCCLRSRRAKGSITGGPSFLRYRGPSVPASGTLDRAAMIRGDTSSEGSGNDNFAAQGTSTLDGKGGPRGTAGGPALQSYRPYGEGLMIPRAKHQHGPTTASGNNSSSAERGEAAPNREHQLMDYLDGRGPKKVLPDRDGKMTDTRSSEVLSAGGRTSVSSTSQFRDRTVSEVRSFDETTIQPATRRPAQYYQSDAAAMESDGMSARDPAGARDSVLPGQKTLIQQLLSFPQPFTITRPKVYKSLPRE